MEIIENTIKVTDNSNGIQLSEQQDIVDSQIELIINEFQYLEIFDD